MVRSIYAAGVPGFALVLGLLGVGPAVAAVPDNDNRANAIRVAPPQTLTGTLVDATLEPVDDVSDCGPTDASVWYRFTAPKSGAIIVQLDAGGEMDATVDLYRQVRSTLSFEDCQATNNAGIATLDNTDLTAGGDYALRIGRRAGSVADTFRLRVLIPNPPPSAPGKPLPTKGARGSVDRLVNTGDAYSVRMRAGVTMRLSLKVNQCTALEVFGPNAKSFGNDAVLYRRCGGFSLFTPEKSGRYSLVVWAGRSRDNQKYRLQAARAGRDDTAPGIFIGNNARVTGRVNGGLDARDLYRFDVTRRSQLQLSTTGDTEMRLMRDDGRGMGRDSEFDRTVAPGRYFVAVEGQGKYTLTRVSRTITRASARFNGRSSTTVSPGSSVRLGLQVSPAVSGRGTLMLQRFDPVDGWQFVRRYNVTVSAGSAQVSFTPQVGRYRLSGEFQATRTAAGSQTGTARLKVQGPLVD